MGGAFIFGEGLYIWGYVYFLIIIYTHTTMDISPRSRRAWDGLHDEIVFISFSARVQIKMNEQLENVQREFGAFCIECVHQRAFKEVATLPPPPERGSASRLEATQ